MEPCIRCGKMHVRKVGRRICPDCYREQNRMYQARHREKMAKTTGHADDSPELVRALETRDHEWFAKRIQGLV